MDISIIIINYKTPEILNLCIKSLKATIADIDYEIIAVDIESDYKTEYLIRESFPDAVFIPTRENVGYSKAVNLAIRNSNPKSKYLFVLNADIIAKEEAVNKIFGFMERNQDVGISGPQLLNFDNSVQDSCFKFYTPKIILYRRTFFRNFSFSKKLLEDFLMKNHDHNLTQPVEWLMGSALFVRRSALEKAGLMDERFFMYFEDVDWCRRFWKNGCRVIYFPEAKMAHYHGKQSTESKKYALIHIISAIKYFTKYLGKPLPKIH